MKNPTIGGVIWRVVSTFRQSAPMSAWWPELRNLDAERAQAAYVYLRDNYDTQTVTVDEFLAVYEVGVPA